MASKGMYNMMQEPLFTVSNTLQKKMQEIRRTLHQHPELAYQEKQTSALICQELDRLGIRSVSGLAGGTGIRAELGTIDGPCIALRADMDALPVHEETKQPPNTPNQ
ncbi:MAG: amidohydrolase, partial [Candidatus Electrothrix sp. AR3]|nr:amidohydrolase [Candidatus Electrothrix sp. AR3]